MGRKSESRTCGRATVTVTQFEAMRAIPLGAKLMRIFGPALVELAEIEGSDNVRALSGMFAELFPKLEGTEATTLIQELLAGTTAQYRDEKGVEQVVSLSSETILNMVFETDFMALLEACVFSVEVNFRSFFDKARGAVSTPQPAAEGSSSNSIPTLPKRGPRGGSGLRVKQP
jgi:Phage tail assembly chaperone protein, TAC